MRFGLRLKHTPPPEIAERVDRAAKILGLEKLLTRFPRQLSGGQRQRVAMGRAMVRNPQVFLFDDRCPISTPSCACRCAPRSRNCISGSAPRSSMYDQIEAMTMADKIVVMHDGAVEQIGAPLELYDRPRNLFVAGFIGSPAVKTSVRGVLGAAARRHPRCGGPQVASLRSQ